MKDKQVSKCCGAEVDGFTKAEVDFAFESVRPYDNPLAMLTKEWLTRQAEVVSRESGLPMADLFRFGRMILIVAGVPWAKKFEENDDVPRD